MFASLYNDRAIAYRAHHGFDHRAVALSVGVQQMVRSDLGASGVMFTLDTDSGFRDVVLITSSYGLGETVVQGAVNPDEFCVYKPSLRAGRPAILRRTLGAKALKMVYAKRGEGRVAADVAGLVARLVDDHRQHAGEIAAGERRHQLARVADTEQRASEAELARNRQPARRHLIDVGIDTGGEGARTMMLIYNLPATGAIYQRFAGVDGSAYFVGGVGMTALTSGGIVVVPIRSGVGLRLGANVGYLKFTPQATWNPF